MKSSSIDLGGKGGERGKTKVAVAILVALLVPPPPPPPKKNKGPTTTICVLQVVCVYTPYWCVAKYVIII